MTKVVVTDVCAEYDGREVVHGASLQLSPGRVTALIGPNGSGKTTLLRTMAGLHKMSSGEVTLVSDGGSRPIGTLRSREFARQLTMLSQHRPTPLGATVADVVGYGRYPHRAKWTGRDDEGSEAIAAALELTGLSALADHPVDQLSGGQLQRAWLASCVAQRTPVMLLDEPTNHLDLRFQTELLALVRELADVRSVAIGVVLHDLNQASAVADDVVLLVGGSVVASGSADEVLQPDRLSAAYEVDIEILDDGVRRRICALGALREPASGPLSVAST